MKRITLLLLLALTLSLQMMAQQAEHTVARGETLAKIAQQYGISEEQLKAANPNLKIIYTGAKLTIPSPGETVNVSPIDAPEDKIEDPGETPQDTVSQNKVKLKKFFKSVGKGLSKAAKVSGAVAKAVVVTKLKGGSYYDAINNAVNAADSTIHGGKDIYDLPTGNKKKKESITEMDNSSKRSDDINAMLGEEAPTNVEMEAMKQEYETKYKKFDTELAKLRTTFDKANKTVKSRTWKAVSESAADYRKQMQKIREECEMYTGFAITPSSNEEWRPIVPKS